MSAANSNVLDSMVLGEVNAKGFIDDSVRDEFFKKLRVQQDNRTCFDCSNRNPTWISLSHGTFVCLECSGEHRRKGVHISFVRSADMDSFTPEQIAKMSVGGNGKAREYFKGHGMGRTSETGKPVDYNSKAALRYRQMIEKDAQEACKKLGCVCKPSAAAADAEPEAQSMPAADDFFNFEGLGGAQSKAKAAAPPGQSKLSMPPAAAAAPPSIPKAESTPSVNVVVRRPEAEPSLASIKTNSAPALCPGAKPGAKPKIIDFDFDFDELEKEANLPPPPKPEPAPVPKVAAPAAPPKPVQSSSMAQPAMGGYAKAAAPAASFANRKSFGSDDFFSEFESSADRQNQYSRFAGQGAISSDAFFGREEQAPEKGTLTSLLSAVSSAGSELLASAKGSDTHQSGMPMIDGISSYIGRRMNN